MKLHIMINGATRMCTDVEPGAVHYTVDRALKMTAGLSTTNRVTLYLDSDAHKNVVYIINKKLQELSL